MEKKAPTALRIGVIAGFVLSCFALAVFLWISFGGPIPLRPEPYRIEIPFDEATQLADQADVRISGVSVGNVSSIDLPPDGSQAMATIDVDSRFSPLPADVRATLRLKTLLGETYVELTPGSDDGPDLPEGATLPKAQVAQTVQLDEILRTFDEPTREAFRTWMRDSSIAIDDRGRSLSNSFALFPPVFEGFEKIFRTLDTQQQAVRQLFANGAITFNALSERQGQLSSLIRSSNEVLRTTAERDDDLIAAFTAFPTFLDESRLTLARLRGFALNADPLMRQLVPVAKQLSPTLNDLGRLAPELRDFFVGLRPVIDNAPKAFPAFQRLFADDFPPLLRALDPFLRNLNPILVEIGDYRRELTALVGNAAAATNGVSTVGKRNVHYLRALTMFNPGSLATFPGRLTGNRNNAYSQPGAYSKVGQGMESFETRQCASGISASLDPSSPSDPSFQARVEADPGAELADAQDFFDRLKLFAFGDQLSTDGVPAPRCALQAAFDPIGRDGVATAYQHVLEELP